MIKTYKKRQRQKDLIFLFKGPGSGVTNSILLGACIISWSTFWGFIGWGNLGGIGLGGRMIGLVSGHLLVHLLQIQLRHVHT